MKNRLILVFVVFVALALIQGCAAGVNSVLFATRSNVGFDADTAPPNLEISISRYEGVLEPTFEDGQTLPVMASFSSRSQALRNFFFGVNSTFSTGEAAFIMSYLYNDPLPKRDEHGKWDHLPYETVTLAAIPQPKNIFGGTIRYIEPGMAKRVVFGTDTILGVKVKWSGLTAEVPSSVNIGFKRTEATWAPVTMGTNRTTDSSNPDKPVKADVASLLATLDTGVMIEGTDTRLRHIQYFATGSAANNLARRPEVREAMLKRAYPDQKIQMVKEASESRKTNRELIDQIMEIFNKGDDSKKNKILAEARSLKLVGTSATIKTFPGELARHEGGDSAITEKLRILLEDAKV